LECPLPLVGVVINEDYLKAMFKLATTPTFQQELKTCEEARFMVDYMYICQGK